MGETKIRSKASMLLLTLILTIGSILPMMTETANATEKSVEGVLTAQLDKTNVVETGDTMTIWPFIVLMAVAAIVIIAIVIYQKKKKNKK